MDDNIYSIDEIKEKTTPLFELFSIKKAVIFGSYAKKSATEHSDIDIYIDSGGLLNGLNFFEFYGRVEECLNKKLDLVEAVDIQVESLLFNEINKHGVVIYER